MKMHQLTTQHLLVGAMADYEDVRQASGFTVPEPVIFFYGGNQKISLVSMSGAIKDVQHAALKTMRTGDALWDSTRQSWIFSSVVATKRR